MNKKRLIQDTKLELSKKIREITKNQYLIPQLH